MNLKTENLALKKENEHLRKALQMIFASVARVSHEKDAELERTPGYVLGTVHARAGISLYGFAGYNELTKKSWGATK